jgi:hypothetical protein
MSVSTSFQRHLSDAEAEEGYKLWLSELPLEERVKAEELRGSGKRMYDVMHHIHSARGGECSSVVIWGGLRPPLLTLLTSLVAASV